MARLLKKVELKRAGDPDPFIVRKGGFSITRSANQGWSCNATISADIGISFPMDQIWRVKLTQLDTSTGETTEMESPPMVAHERQRTAGKGQRGGRRNTPINLHLIDATLAKLATPGQSFPTYRGLTSTAIAAEVANFAGTSVAGLDSWPIVLEEIKQQQPLDALRRLGAVAGQDFQVGETGGINFYSAVSSLGTIDRREVVSLQDSFSMGARVTGLRIERQNALTGTFEREFPTSDFYTFALPVPMASCAVQDISTTGYIDQIGLWNGDPTTNGQLVQFFSNLSINGIGVPVSGSPPITHVSLNTYLSVVGLITGEDMQGRCRIVGSPYGQSSGIQQQPSFSTFIGNNEWPAQEPWSEPLIPSQAFAEARAAAYLWQRGKSARPVSGAWSRWLLDALPGQQFSPRILGVDWPLLKIDSVTHGDGGTTFQGHVITY